MAERDRWVLEVDGDGERVRLDEQHWATTDTPDKPVSAYATASPEEDMADAIAFYRINPRQVFHHSPIRARLCQQLSRETRASP